MLVYLSKSATIANIFMCWKIGLFCIFNIVKDMMNDLIRDMSKIMI